jgi:peptidoglycan/LPS O-acetylase OafA/YrhL
MQAISHQEKPRRREIELDFVRGIAILLVLDYHSPRTVLLTPFTLLGFPNFGWCGVDIFFVLSGFLVGGLLVREWELHGRIDAKRFLIRRAFKIWPQYYVFLFAILLTGHRPLRELWGNLLNIQNYTGGIAHTWSLAVEEHAYLLLLALFTIAPRLKLSIRHLLLAIASLSALVLVWRFVLAAHGTDAFPRTETRIDGILYGLILAMLYHTAPKTFGRLQSLRWLWIAIVTIALLDFRFIPLKQWWTGPLSWLCADAAGVALLFLLYRHKKSHKRPVLYRLVAWIGLYSYGIYLWHISFMALVLATVQRLPTRLGTALELTAPTFLGITIGVLTTKLIEFPTLSLRDRLIPKRIDSAVSVGPLLTDAKHPAD